MASKSYSQTARSKVSIEQARLCKQRGQYLHWMGEVKCVNNKQTGSLSNANSDPTCLPASLYLTNGDRAGERKLWNGECHPQFRIRRGAQRQARGEHYHPGLNRVSQHETNFFLHSAYLHRGSYQLKIGSPLSNLSWSLSLL